jgi:hypothetical protein
MSWTIEFDEQQQVLRVTSNSVLGVDQIRQLTVEVINAVNTNSISRVLLDYRGMTPEIKTVDIYRLPRLYDDQQLQRAVRAAMVVSHSSEKLADFAFYEDVVQNAGFQIRVFTDYEMARQWLHD